MQIIDRDNRREHSRRRIAELEAELRELNDRIDALVDAVARMARQHYRPRMLPENSISSALHDARRR